MMMDERKASAWHDRWQFTTRRLKTPAETGLSRRCEHFIDLPDINIRGVEGDWRELLIIDFVVRRSVVLEYCECVRFWAQIILRGALWNSRSKR